MINEINEFQNLSQVGASGCERLLVARDRGSVGTRGTTQLGVVAGVTPAAGTPVGGVIVTGTSGSLAPRTFGRIDGHTHGAPLAAYGTKRPAHLMTIHPTSDHDPVTQR